MMGYPKLDARYASRARILCAALTVRAEKKGKRTKEHELSSEYIVVRTPYCQIHERLVLFEKPGNLHISSSRACLDMMVWP